MIFVGVDPSITNTGVVMLAEDGEVIDVFNSKTIKHSNNNDYIKLKTIANAVVNIIAVRGSTEVQICYEDYSFSSVNRTYRLGELGGVLRSELVAAFGNIHLVAPRLLKKFAVNTGSADKPEIIKAATEESQYLKDLPAKQLTSDICDAYFLARICWYLFNWDKLVKLITDKKLLRQRIETLRGLYSDLQVSRSNSVAAAVNS